MGANAGTHELRYAYDFAHLMRPPNGSEVAQVTWAREIDGTLYVETTHLTYATATRGRNAYLNAIDLGTASSPGEARRSWPTRPGSSSSAT